MTGHALSDQRTGNRRRIESPLQHTGRRIKAGLIAALGLTLAACGGGGGSSADEAPIAAALVVGQGQNNVEVTVRSGAEFVLNGENSDGTRFPIDNATWRQTDATGIVLQLDKRTEFTRAVRVPMVDTPTTLTFELTVTNTDGETMTTPVTINVVPVADGNRFLEFFQLVAGQYTVVAVLDPGTVATSDVEFTITERQLADYADRTSSDGVANQFDLQIGATQTRNSRFLDGTQFDWTTQAEGVNAFYNPNLCFAVPKVDLDDINVHFDDTDPDRGIADHRRDSVAHSVELSLAVTSGTCTDSASAPVDCQSVARLYVLKTNGEVADTISASPTQKRILVDVLKASEDPTSLQPESLVSATAYYAAVDPFDRRTTFADWLSNAGFTDGGGEFVQDGLSDHALYINNYDLGFTRDMFVRRAPSGDVFAYVTNYPALRPAVLGTDVLATVAMEFGPPDQDPTALRLVKFFVFVPDGEGNQPRVKSLNFDGRGEKWVPGACVACHGGELRNLQPDGSYPSSGDIDAAFLPWDLDSFLYVDAADPDLIDPLVQRGFEINPGYLTPATLQEFSRENQEPAFRRMNEAVLATMKEKDNESVRFDLAREQIHAWYGSTDVDSDVLPAATYDGLAYIQDGWAEAGLEDVYHEVFARHCRICHSQAKDNNQLRTLADLMDPIIEPKVRRFLFEDGLMPNARLDMDRFWVDYRGAAESPGRRLAIALGHDDLADGPGPAVARIKGGRIQTVLPRALMVDIEAIDSIPQVVNEDGIRLDGSISGLAATYAWQFTEVPPGSNARLIGDTTAKPAFLVDRPGRFVVELTAANSRGSSVASIIVDASPGGPKLVAGASLSVTLPESIPSRESSVTIGTSELQWTDPDSAADQLTFRVTTLPIRGTLSVDTFTQDDVNNGLVIYTQTTDIEAPNDSFVYSVTDETGNEIPDQSFAINITTLNDEPVLVDNGPLQVVEADSATLMGVLAWTDIEDDVSFTLTTAPVEGVLERPGGPLAAGAVFTQSEIDSDMIEYNHNDMSQATSDSLAYTVTDGTVTLGPTVLDIDIAAVDNVPQLRTGNLSVEAARAVRLSGGLANNSIPITTIAVTDADTLNPENISITVASAPATGRIEIRSNSGATAATIAAGGSTTLAAVLAGDADPADGLFYVSEADASDLAPADDLFSIAIADQTNPGTCENTNPATAACDVVITVGARTDGPTGNTNPASLNGYLDATVSRNGAARTSTTIADVPWADVLIDGSILDFSDAGPSGAGECPLMYTVVSVPASNVGLLKRGAAPSTGPADPDVIGVGETFLHSEVTNPAGVIYYENREIGGGNHAFVLDVSDCLVTIRRTLNVTRALNFAGDVGWVIDTVWIDASNGYDTTTFGCPVNTANQRACRQCHWRSDIDNTQNGCAASATQRFWTNGVNGVAGGTIQCDQLEPRYANGLLPDYPTQGGHPGAVIFEADSAGTPSYPHQMLIEWDGDTTECP